MTAPRNTARPAYDASWKEWSDWAGLRFGDEIDSQAELGRWSEPSGTNCYACGTAVGTLLMEDSDDGSTYATHVYAFAGDDGLLCEDCTIELHSADVR